MKIYIIDDEESCGNALAKAIEPSGHQCLIFTSAVRALEQYPHDQPALVITDLKMPEMDGLTLVKKIREMGSSAHIVVNTGYGQMESVTETLAAGADAFFSKPVKLSEIMRIVYRVQAKIESTHSAK